MALAFYPDIESQFKNLLYEVDDESALVIRDTKIRIYEQIGTLSLNNFFIVRKEFDCKEDWTLESPNKKLERENYPTMEAAAKVAVEFYKSQRI